MKKLSLYFNCGLTGVLALVLLGGLSPCSAAKKIAAKGEGVEVSMEFVLKMQEYYEENTIHRAQKEELIRSGVEHWLFAREAVIQDIAQADADLEQMDAIQVILFYNMYLTHLVQQEPLGDDVLLSYYRAFPERFMVQSEKQEGDEAKKQDHHSGPEDQKELISFEEARENIRRTLLAAKIPLIQTKAFENLVEKYNVQIFN